MDKFDLDVNEKDVFGGIDRLLVNFGMILIAFIPTHGSLIFRPKRIAVMLLGEEPDGRKALLLGPGITFILTLLFLFAVAYFANDVFQIGGETQNPDRERGGIRDAIVQGNFWRSVVLAFPVYLVALGVGLTIHFAHMICRLKANLTQCVGIGLYLLSTALLFLVGLGISSDITGGEPTVFMIMFFIFGFFFGVLPWQIYSFSRHAFDNAKGTAAAVALLCAFLFLVAMAILGFTVNYLESIATASSNVSADPS